MAWGAGAALLLVAGLAAFAFVRTADMGPKPSADRALVMLIAGDEEGVPGPLLIADVDVADWSVTVIDPSTAATIPGTSFETVFDAYAFSGGEGVADAIGEAADANLYYVAVPEATVIAWADELGPIDLELPSDMDIFTGDSLLTLYAGRESVYGEELRWVLNGAAYLGEPEAADVREQVAEAVLRMLAAQTTDAALLAGRGDIETDMPSAALPDYIEGIRRHLLP